MGARSSRSGGRRKRTGFPVRVDGDVGEYSFGHFDFLILADAAANPALDFDRHGCATDFDNFRVACHFVADEDGAMERHRGYGDGDDPPARASHRDGAASEVHLRQKPAAEYVALGVRIGRHRNGAQRRFAAWQIVGRFGCVFHLRSFVRSVEPERPAILRRNLAARTRGPRTYPRPRSSMIGAPLLLSRTPPLAPPSRLIVPPCHREFTRGCSQLLTYNADRLANPAVSTGESQGHAGQRHPRP